MKRETALDRAIRDAFAEEAVPYQIHSAILAACGTLPEKRTEKQKSRGAAADSGESSFIYPEEYKKPWLAGRLALAALCLILAAGLGLLGLNAISPETAENLPGLGGFFQAINGNRQEDPPPEQKPQLPSFPEESPDPFGLPTEDNGTTLEKILVTESGVQITAEVSFMGRTSYNPMQYYQSTPFGTWANLQTAEDAEKVPAGCVAGALLGDLPETGETGSYQTGSGLSDGPFQVMWAFDDADVSQPLVLTVYEWDLFWDAKAPLGNYRVTAEFTIDLESKTVTPSEHYKKAGLQKITPQECLDTKRYLGFINGWIPAGVSYCPLWAYSDRDESYYRIDLFGYLSSAPGPQDTPENLTLECYRGDELVGTVSTQSEEDRGQPIEDEDFRMSMGNQTYYQTETGRYAYEETEPGRMQLRSRHVVFGVPASLFGFEEKWQEEQALINDEIRFTLRSADTGEIIYEDIMEWYRQYRQGIIDLYAENTGLSSGTVSLEPPVEGGTFTAPSPLPEEAFGPSPVPYTSPMPSPIPVPYSSPAPIEPVSPKNDTSHALENDP